MDGTSSTFGNSTWASAGADVPLGDAFGGAFGLGGLRGQMQLSSQLQQAQSQQQQQDQRRNFERNSGSQGLSAPFESSGSGIDVDSFKTFIREDAKYDSEGEDIEEIKNNVAGLFNLEDEDDYTEGMQGIVSDVFGGNELRKSTQRKYQKRQGQANNGMEAVSGGDNGWDDDVMVDDGVKDILERFRFSYDDEEEALLQDTRVHEAVNAANAVKRRQQQQRSDQNLPVHNAGSTPDWMQMDMISPSSAQPSLPAPSVISPDTPSGVNVSSPTWEARQTEQQQEQEEQAQRQLSRPPSVATQQPAPTPVLRPILPLPQGAILPALHDKAAKYGANILSHFTANPEAFAKLIPNLDDLILALDRDTRILYASPPAAVAAFLGVQTPSHADIHAPSKRGRRAKKVKPGRHEPIEGEGVVGKLLTDWLHVDDRGTLIKAVQKGFDEGRGYTIYVRVLDPGVNSVPVLTSASDIDPGKDAAVVGTIDAEAGSVGGDSVSGADEDSEVGDMTAFLIRDANEDEDDSIFQLMDMTGGASSGIELVDDEQSSQTQQHPSHPTSPTQQEHTYYLLELIGRPILDPATGTQAFMLQIGRKYPTKGSQAADALWSSRVENLNLRGRLENKIKMSRSTSTSSERRSNSREGVLSRSGSTSEGSREHPILREAPVEGVGVGLSANGVLQEGSDNVGRGYVSSYINLGPSPTVTAIPIPSDSFASSQTPQLQHSPPGPSMVADANSTNYGESWNSRLSLQSMFGPAGSTASPLDIIRAHQAKMAAFASENSNSMFPSPQSTVNPSNFAQQYQQSLYQNQQQHVQAQHPQLFVEPKAISTSQASIPSTSSRSSIDMSTTEGLQSGLTAVGGPGGMSIASAESMTSLLSAETNAESLNEEAVAGTATSTTSVPSNPDGDASVAQQPKKKVSHCIYASLIRLLISTVLYIRLYRNRKTRFQKLTNAFNAVLQIHQSGEKGRKVLKRKFTVES
jgi:PAS domain-containing protein